LNYKEISAKLKEVLNLKGSPVAVKLIRDCDQLPAGIPESDIHMRFCNSVFEARRGKSWILPAKKNSCAPGASAF
jgi:uncharacterized protein (DUF169 family)